MAKKYKDGGHIGPHKMSKMSNDGFTNYAPDNRAILEGEAKGRVRLDGGYMGMLNEDRRAPANLPQEVIHKFYPGTNSADRYYLDDTYNGIDEDIENSVERIERFPSKTMY